MFVVTNRLIVAGETGLDRFGETPNAKGPNELRLFEARRAGGKWQADLLPDVLTREMKEEVGLPVTKTAFGSQYVARKLRDRLRAGKKNLVVFVHGFNNDVAAVLDRAEGFEKLYGVEVLAFSWPANGGGVGGVASYKSDKRDARVSVGAVYRTLAKARAFLDEFSAEEYARIVAKAAADFPDNPELQREFITTAAEKSCPFTVNLVLHSMGNYLFEQIQRSDTFDEHHMLFDNVVLAAADCNSEGHAAWVDRIRCRKRIFITINEDDVALRASRVKAGDDQLPRLGHWVHNLDATLAHYVDFTDAKKVGDSHAYFEGAPVADKNGAVYRFFRAALNGERAENELAFDASSNTYRPA